MKILWISHLLPYPPKGGVLQRSYHLLRQAGRRHEVHLAALIQPSMQDTERERMEAEKELGRFCESVESFHIPAEQTKLRWWSLVIASFFRRRPYDVNWLRSRSFASHLRDLAGGEWDLVHADTIGLAQYLEAVPSVPSVLTHHNVESAMMRQRAEGEDRLLRRLYFGREAEKLARYERRVCPDVDLNVVVSDAEAHRLQDVAGQVELSVVENGVDVEYFQPETEVGEGGGLVFAGGMNGYANREAMLFFVREVWPLLQEEDHGRRLTIVGRDPPREIVSLADGDRVRVPGFVDDVRPYLDEAATYVCPIRSGGGTRLKVLDALAMQKPLVATEFAVHGLGLEEGVHYLGAETPVEYVRQVGRLEEDAELRRRMAWAGRRLVEANYSWDVVGRHLHQAYEHAVTGATP